MKISITGVTGNMGIEVIKALISNQDIEQFKVLVLPFDRRIKLVKKLFKKDPHRLVIVRGSIANDKVLEQIVLGADYIINMAAVIPPQSDANPQYAVKANEIGVQKLVHHIEQQSEQPKLIHISTVALYGHRSYNTMWGRVGDPLLVSPYDIYSITKLRGELAVLESDIKNWVVLRQTAMLHRNMFKDNANDGLVFHTCLNTPLEWVSQEDSGKLIANIIKRDQLQVLNTQNFWKQVFNIGSVAENQLLGSDILEQGYKLAGGNLKTFFKPNFNITRNFHGIWFADGYKLQQLFNFQGETVSAFWRGFEKKYRLFKIAKLFPKKIVAWTAVNSLFNHKNSPRYWYKHRDIPRMIAYFGSIEQYDSIGNDWSNFYLLKDYPGDILKLTEDVKLTDVGYDTNKDKSEITKEDLENIAYMHGGKLISHDFNTGDVYRKLIWQDQDENEFEMKPISVLSGHWHNICYKEYAWEFDRLARKDKIYAQVWYDSHYPNENYYYYFDEFYQAKIKKEF